MITSGRSTRTISEAPITSSSAGMRGPSAMRRRMRPACTPSGASHSVECGTKGQKARRPKIVSSAGSRVSIERAAQATPMATIGPMPEVPLTFAISQAEERGDHGRGGRQHGRARRPHRGRHRLVAVQRVVKLLSVSARR